MAFSAAPFLASTPSSKANLRESSLTTADQLQAALEFRNAERVLALGIPALDDLLPQRGLHQGSVIELQVHGASGAATSFALCACRAAQRARGWSAQNWSARDWPKRGWPAEVSAAEASAPEASAPGASAPEASRAVTPRQEVDALRWCAFIDPSASLFAPGIARLGVSLERLLVVHPDIDSVERVAVRIAEAKAMSLLVIDLRGALGNFALKDSNSRDSMGSSQRWPRAVRRLALAVKHLATCVLLITPAEPRAVPLPVAMRLEFARASADSFKVKVGKERTGRISSPREVPWSAFDEVWQ